MLLLLFTCTIACGAYQTGNRDAHKDWPRRSELFENFRNAKALLVVYHAGDNLSQEQLEHAFQNLPAYGADMQVIFREDDEITEEELKSYPLYIAGTSENLLIKRFDDNLPYQLVDNGFRFDAMDCTDKSDILKISFYPNPFNPIYPVSILLCNNPASLSEYFGEQSSLNRPRLFWDMWGYELIHGGRRTMIGNFSEDSTTLWDLDKKVHWEFEYEGKLVNEQTNFKLYDHQTGIPKNIMDAYGYNLQFEEGLISAFTSKKTSGIIPVHICPTVEAVGLAFNYAGQTFIENETNTVYTVINDEYAGISNGYELIPVLRSQLGQPRLTALEHGLAVYFTKNWQQNGFQYWGNKLNLVNAFPPLSELLDNELFEANSPLIIDCMSALFIEFMIETKGKEELLRNYLEYENRSSELLALESEWNVFLWKNYHHPLKKEPKRQIDKPFLQGFNFAHEGYSVYNGYLGSEAMTSLERLKSIHANTIALMPYSGFRSMEDPHPFRISDYAGGENDAAIVRSAYKASRLGMTVMIKPQIWSWQGWTGDITMNSEQEWKLFFEYYSEWIIHYAMLAEIHGAGIFCAGVEFKNATLSHPEEWIKIFDKIKTIFNGQITYAANWGEEFERVNFWSHLDYIGVDCYYPLCPSPSASDEQLLAQMKKNLATIKAVKDKYKKPILFTEIGFKSIESPWISPHSVDDSQAYNEESQQRCFEAMFEAMHNEDWISGVYIWKWPSYMGFAKEYAKDFNPCGKLAESTIQKWFTAKN